VARLPLPSFRNRGLPTFGAGLLVGAAVVVGAWALGDTAAGDLADDPGIPPPEYAYLDNPRVLAYLAQIEGGLSTSEKRTRQVESGGSGSVSAGGVEVGAMSNRGEFVEQVVTPTATTRFYRLLDRLRAKDYLRELDAAAAPAEIGSALQPVAEGEFIRIRNCRLWTPTYAALLRQIRGARATPTADEVFGGAGSSMLRREETEAAARNAANPRQAALGPALLAVPPTLVRAWPSAARRYAGAVPGNPRTAYASCRGAPALRPRGMDLLLPIPLAALAGTEELLAGPVTVVGKVVRRVRTDADVYVDESALAAYDGALRGFPAEVADVFEPGLETELASDVTVLPPGAVVLPIAIYK
jgi:hypothetical protein